MKKKRVFMLVGFTALGAVIGVLSIYNIALSDPECYMEFEI